LSLCPDQGAPTGYAKTTVLYAITEVAADFILRFNLSNSSNRSLDAFMTVAEVGGLHRHLLLSARRAKAAPPTIIIPRARTGLKLRWPSGNKRGSVASVSGGRANDATLVVH
jgi:hypothetical protein